MAKNAAVSIKVTDWGFQKSAGGWIELEISGSFEDDEGQVVFNQPEKRVVSFPINTKKSTVSPRMVDPRQASPL